MKVTQFLSEGHIIGFSCSLKILWKLSKAFGIWCSRPNEQYFFPLPCPPCSALSCYLPSDLTGSYVAPITPAHPSVCWSGVGGSRKPKWQLSVSLSPPRGTDAHVLVWTEVWVSSCSLIQLLKPNDWEINAWNWVRAQSNISVEFATIVEEEFGMLLFKNLMEWSAAMLNVNVC